MNILRQVAARYKGFGRSHRGLWPGLGVSVRAGVHGLAVGTADASARVALVGGGVSPRKRDTLD
ncbi:hypothetical protein [Rhodoglobus sp.]